MSSSFYYEISISNYTFTIVEENDMITSITLNKMVDDMLFKKTKLIAKTIKELEEYFEGKRKVFDIPIMLSGTNYQKLVWSSMQSIPYGKTITYKELAIMTGNPKAYRAVGNICHNNKLLIIVPCHRVVASNGVGGFGCGIKMKKELLELEF